MNNRKRRRRIAKTDSNIEMILKLNNKYIVSNTHNFAITIYDERRKEIEKEKIVG